MRWPTFAALALLAAPPAAAQVVAIDPAHGTPTNANEAMRRESVFARVLAERLRDSLLAAGIRSVVTAKDSSDPGTVLRVERAKAGGATLLLGLHSESPALLPAGVHGTLVGDTTDATVRGIIHRLQPSLDSALGGPLQIIHTSRLAAIRRFGVPGLLIKLGDNSDPADLELLGRDPCLGAIAGAIRRAIR